MLGHLKARIVQVISSDEEENTPKRSVGPSKSKSPSAATPTEEVIDLTEGFSELPSRKDRSRTRGTSPPQSRSQTLDLLGWEEYRSPLAGIRLRAFSLGASHVGSELNLLPRTSAKTLYNSAPTSCQCYAERTYNNHRRRGLRRS